MVGLAKAVRGGSKKNGTGQSGMRRDGMGAAEGTVRDTVGRGGMERGGVKRNGSGWNGMARAWAWDGTGWDDEERNGSGWGGAGVRKRVKVLVAT